MAPKLYVCELSPPVRSVLITAKAIDLDLELVSVDLGKQEQLEADFVKINPQHTVPTLVEEDGFVLWESHAIMPYIVEKYSSDDSLYPKDLKLRATIHQRMHYDTYSMATRKTAIQKIFYEGAKEISEKHVKEIETDYELIEKLLDTTEWIATDSVTIADLSLAPSILTADIIVPVDKERFPNIAKWLEKVQALPYFEENKNGHETLKDLILERLSDGQD